MKMDRLNKSDDSLLIRVWGDNPKLRIVDFLLDNILFDFSKKDITEGANLSRPTFKKYFDCLVKEKIVVVSRKFGNTKLYKLNKKNPVVKVIMDTDQNLSRIYADKVEEKLMIPA